MSTGPVTSAMFLNRELSWLAFNERVVEEAADRTTPLLERIKFVAIAASNLDEFFMVRVAALEEAAAAGDESRDLAGLTATEQLRLIRQRTHAFVTALYALTRGELLPQLAERNIRLWPAASLGDRALAVNAFFRDHVLPVLTPLGIDESRPFPLLASLSLNLALRLAPTAGETAPRLAIVQVPAGLPRLMPVADSSGYSFVLLEDIIRTHTPQLFPGQVVLESAVIRLSRDAEIDLDDEGGRTHLELVEREIRRRRSGDVVRLEIESSASDELVLLLRQRLELDAGDVYAVPGPVDLRVLAGLSDVAGFEDLRDPPVIPAAILEGAAHPDLFSMIDERDVLLHHPYDAYDPVVALLEQAAEDPDVLAIKQTLYRASVGSPMIASLQRAAEANKQVTVLVELTARFDEERNIRWARALEAAGAHVIYGVRGYKTHAKICLIVRRTPRGLRRYVHVGTGNYNERTARIYTDFGLMTAAKAFAEDASAFFNALTGYSDPPRMKRLVMAPTDLRRRFVRLINRERGRAESGEPAEIVAKMNSLIDEEIITSLYAASQAGVRIRLNVRGICALRPGLPGLSANIEVISIVDRFLEHARAFYFLNGGDEQVYLASADWMTRNLDKRIELMFPVEDAGHQATVLNALRAMFRDTVKARRLNADGSYTRVTPEPGQPAFRVQQQMQDDAHRRIAQARERASAGFQAEVGHTPPPTASARRAARVPR
ncbi:MAG: polyphosphate kinase 1 [Vicinamibacterales bacterium]